MGGSICQGDFESNIETTHNIFKVVATLGFSFILLISLCSVATTLYLLIYTKFADIPRFVTVQMLLLNIAWVCLLIYNLQILMTMLQDNFMSAPVQSLSLNFAATLGDLCYLLHDWLFL